MNTVIEESNPINLQIFLLPSKIVNLFFFIVLNDEFSTFKIARKENHQRPKGLFLWTVDVAFKEAAFRVNVELDEFSTHRLKRTELVRDGLGYGL